LDYKHEGMLIAMIQHPPAFGLKLKSFDASQALKMPGIKDVFKIKLYEDGFEQGGFDTRTFNELLVAVVGKTTWEVMQARKKLVVEWMPAGDTKDTMQGRGGKREVVVPGELETPLHSMKKCGNVRQ
jgi:isoquinoline 1-oxidoreductase beta subunit